MTNRRNTLHRVETWNLLYKHSSGDGITALSNRAIRDMLAESGRTVTLPAVTARLQSLESGQHIKIHYHVGPYGRVSRAIELLAPPKPPIHPRKQATPA